MELSCIQPEHIEEVRLWRNAQMDVLRQNSVISPQQQIEYYQSHVWNSLSNPQPNIILLACHVDSQFIGYGGLVHISWQDKRAEISFLVAPSIADSSIDYSTYYSNYLELVSEMAFNDLALNRICTETWATRKAPMIVLESAGFYREGVLREHTIQNKTLTDSIIHSKLLREYQAS